EATPFPAWAVADDGVAGGVGVQRGGGFRPTVGRGLHGQPCADGAAEVPQPSGSTVCDTGSIDRDAGRVYRAGSVGTGGRCLQCGGTSLTLVGEPSSRHGPDTTRSVPSQPVASHCSRSRGEPPFGARSPPGSERVRAPGRRGSPRPTAAPPGTCQPGPGRRRCSRPASGLALPAAAAFPAAT